MPELHRFEYLPPLDQIGVGFEDGVDFLLAGDLLPQQYPAAGLGR